MINYFRKRKNFNRIKKLIQTNPVCFEGTFALHTNENINLYYVQDIIIRLTRSLYHRDMNKYAVFERLQSGFKEIDLNEIEMKVLKTLPLMKFSHEGDTKIFIMTPDPEDGTSILHRLEIVLDGDKHKNMKSCIRLTSNILLHSVYFYICSLGLSEPYNIFELEHIS